MKRLLIVYNPNSTHFKSVKSEVLDQSTTLSGYLVGKYVITKIGFEKNVEKLSGLIEDKDLVIVAGGDATASMAANAVLKSGKDATLGVLPYGNFNDFAHTLKTKTLLDVLDTSKATKFYPLSVFINGKFWRFAPCYVTIGMTAEATEVFGDAKTRQAIKKKHKSSWASYFYLAKWYFKNRRKKTFLPAFRLNSERDYKNQSDYFAINGSSVSHIMRSGRDYLRPRLFSSEIKELTKFRRLFAFMFLSIFSKIPSTETMGDTLEFFAPATIEVEAEGEYKIFENVRKVEIKKEPIFLKVIQK
ncbi:MAG: diacylglycerol kinase family protein [Candidatus Saccharibacteria bacterium]|nr:diacylglycerol kinase family protein [Candidatus Saccharibacteria bacterium]